MDIKTLIFTYALGLWQRRWSVVLVAWAACLVGWPIVASLPDKYVASAVVYVDTDTLLRPLMEGLAIQPDPDRGIDVVRETLLSRPNLEELASRTGLEAAADTPEAKEAVLAGLKDDLSISSRPNSLFAIEYKSTDPVLAEQVVEAILTIFVERNLGNNRADLADSQRFIEAQIADYERQMDEAERRLATFQQEHADELAQQSNALGRLEMAQANLRQLQTELDSAIWRRDQLRSQLATIPAVITERRSTGGPDPALQAHLNQLLLRYTDQHPEVIATRRLIEQSRQGRTSTTVETENPLYKQVAAEVTSLEGQITSMQYRMPQTLEEINAQRRLAEQAPAVQLQLTQLNRDYEIIRENYFSLLTRREAARMTERIDTDTEPVRFRLVEPPLVPLSPADPPRGILFVAVLVVGVGAGLALALARLLLRMPIATVSALRDSFALPVLGAVSRTGGQIRASEVFGFAGGLSVLFVICLWLFVAEVRVNVHAAQFVLAALTGTT
jgi:polysaccharide chain length determinant protein (PEP-CTERM system associated)